MNRTFSSDSDFSDNTEMEYNHTQQNCLLIS